jgi:flagellar assembly protein FliH
MALIKHAATGSLEQEVIVLDLGDLRKQADDIIARAHEQAATVTAEAQQRADAIIAEAHDKGYEKGHAEGLDEGRQQGREEGRREVHDEYAPRLQELLDGWNAALAQWQRQRDDMLAAARVDILRFACAFARKIVLRQVELDPAVVQRQLADVLALMCRPSSVRVAVHPDDQPLINDVLDKLVNDITNCDHAWLEEDPAITRGGCVVTTQDGRIDATIETQIDRIVHTLLPDAHAGGNDAPSEPDGPGDDPDDTLPNDEAPEPPGPRDDEDAT